MPLTDSVRSRHVPATSSTLAWPPSTPSVPTSRATRVTSSANDDSWSTIALIVRLSSRISPWASTVIFCDRSPSATAVVTWAMSRTWEVRLAAMPLTESVRSFQVPATPGHLGLAAEDADRPHLARHAGHLLGEQAQRVGHGVDRLGQRRDLALGLDGDLAREVAVGDRGRRLGDLADLVGEVGRHDVHRVGEVLPRPGHARDLGLAAEPALGADLARDARDLLGEEPQRVGHRVHRLRQRRDLALGLDGHLLREVAAGHRAGHLGDLADLVGEVRGHDVHRVGEVAPACR